MIRELLGNYVNQKVLDMIHLKQKLKKYYYF